MPFNARTKRRMFLRCLRVCCLCFKQCDTNIEAVHIIDDAKGGPSTFENGIPACFDCHARIGHYRKTHPRGNKFSPEELRKRRDYAYQLVESGKMTAMLIEAHFRSQHAIESIGEIVIDATESSGSAPRGLDAEMDSRASRVAIPKSDEIVASLDNFSRSLMRRCVTEGDWIPRPEEQQLRQLIEQSDGRVICLLGGPGSGKTTLLARIANDASKLGYVPIAIKADLIPPTEPVESWAQRQLGLGISIIDAIKSIAQGRKVLIVIDQLDALASLVDLTSSRLNVVLEFIADCAEISNVSVLCSCRHFEFSHDTRLLTLDADCVNLELPAWEEITPTLRKAGIVGAESWPPTFREILRTPQHLQIYLQRFRETGKTGEFRSYQLMLDDLWDRKLRSQKQRDLVYRVAEYLVDQESLWAPAVQFESEAAIVEQLEAEGIIQRQGLQIGFRHQTLFEHAKARRFTKSEQSLFDHVLARQHAILVRPTLWTVLGYLREADRSKYHKELERLMREQLRLHIRYLLIDFLGQVSDPDENETLHLANRFSHPEDRLRALVAISGKECWFRTLLKSHFPAIMCWEVSHLWPMVGVIGNAWTFARADCLRLIRDYWLNDPSKDELTWRALREIDHWDEAAVDMACRVIDRVDVGRESLWWAEHLVYAISEDHPELAPRVFRAIVARELPDRSSPLEHTHAWYGLVAVAVAAPIEFLREAWPWFVDTAVKFHAQQPNSIVNHYGGDLLALDREEGDLDCPLTTAVVTAAVRSAEIDPQAFVEITRNARKVENRPVQRVLTRGFKAAAALIPELALEFLCEDPRRFLLGTYRWEQGDSVALISAISPHLDRDQRKKLEDCILAWTQYRPNHDVDDDQKVWDREARLRLLKAIPAELLSPSAAALVHDEELALPEWDRKHAGGRSGFVREMPPLTKEEMAIAPDAEVLAALRGPIRPDRSMSRWIEAEGGWEEPGGAGAAARELSDLAKVSPGRVTPLLPKLVADGNEWAAGEAIRGLADSSLSSDDACELIREVSKLAPQSEEFRSNAGYLLYKRCEPKKGLPDDVCSLLEEWLDMPWDDDFGRPKPEDDSERQEAEEQRDPVSVLWAPGGGILQTDRSFWPLLAATNGYLMKEPAQTEKWLRMVERLADRSIATETWVHYSSELQWIALKGCNREHAVSVVRKLLAKHPSLSLRSEVIRLIAMISDLLPEDLIREFLGNLSSSKRFEHRQAFGELVTLVALRDTRHDWSQALLAGQLEGLARDSEINESVATGIAFAAARLWDDPNLRAKACRVLCRVIPYTTKKVAHAIGTVFWAKDDFPADEHTDSLLQAIAKTPTVLSGGFVQDLVEHLAKLLPHGRANVLAVCRAIVDRPSSELKSHSQGLFEAGPHLVNIAMTLQRFSDTRSDGLALLETLLRLGLDDAFAILHDIDIRPVSASRREPRTRRRRRR